MKPKDSKQPIILITIKQVAEITGISESGIRSRDQRRQIPGRVKLSEKTVRYYKHIILKWIEEGLAA